jgi:hypothetical protein
MKESPTQVMEALDVPVRGRVLAQASHITLGDRNDAYGPPERNHQRIADMWSAYLNLDQARSDDYIEITANDVAVLMALLKIARTAEDTYHEDNYVDAAAYLAIAAEIRST